MKLSNKGRYAVLAMVDIAKYADDKPCKLSNIALRQNISLHFLEQIFLKLKKSNLVISHRGPGGGYSLSDRRENIKVSDVIAAVDESIKTTGCSNNPNSFCTGKSAKCLTHNLWENLGNLIEDYLESVSLRDLVEGNKDSFVQERIYEQSK
jgi:Rrf2 family iron-sulfur cluster assembly transcriptional regulator